MLDTEQKLEVLGAAAKYDICASTAAAQKRPKDQNYIGSHLPAGRQARPAGICHSYTPDGRCVSLLKVLMTNACKNDCKYCVNRVSNDFERSSFEPEELAKIFMELYRRNYLEGIFLTSGVQKNSAYTMERMVQTLEILRFKYHYQGYVHLKALPQAPADIIERGARLADRMSINLESPSPKHLDLVAGEKNFMLDLVQPMNLIQKHIRQGYLKAGQTTQFVVGAAGETDTDLLRTTNWLYQKKELKRVYFSAFIPPTPHTSPPIPLLREHRLYQADWLLRFYEFKLEELVTQQDGNLRLDLDPKMTAAIKNAEQFPVEVNTASFKMLLKVPGVGPTAAKRLWRARQEHRFTGLNELKNVGVVVKRAKPFILINGRAFGSIKNIMTVQQLELFQSFTNQLAHKQSPLLLT